MRLHERCLLVAVAGMLVATVGCSRLTFIKPDAKRGSVERVAPDYSVRETERSRRAASARNFVLSASGKLRAGDVDGARADALAALKVDPHASEAHAMLGLIAGSQGDARTAGDHYARAAELAPDDGSALNNYGAWLCSEGRVAESLPWFERALAAPGYAEPESALANAGACAWKTGDAALAERASRAALERAPENTVALNTLAELSVHAGRMLDARAFSERRLAAAPATPEALELASRIERGLGDTRAAARYIERLRTEFPQATNASQGEPVEP